MYARICSLFKLNQSKPILFCLTLRLRSGYQLLYLYHYIIFLIYYLYLLLFFLPVVHIYSFVHISDNSVRRPVFKPKSSMLSIAILLCLKTFQIGQEPEFFCSVAVSFSCIYSIYINNSPQNSFFFPLDFSYRPYIQRPFYPSLPYANIMCLTDS